MTNEYSREFRKAGCVTSGADPDMWFLPEGDPGTRAAKTICRDCPVQAECLRIAMANNEQYGVWGGYDSLERRALARREMRTRRADRVMGRSDEDRLEQLLRLAGGMARR